MLYREMGRTGDRVSILGYGCMRFPKTGGRIDEKNAERQVAMAAEKGVNYFDTAYIYPGSEAALGNILSNTGLRDRVMIATKIPPMQVGSRRDMDKILDTQLSRLRTDHIDYYLMHMLGTFGSWERLKRLGIEAFLEEAKVSGKIRRVCFSYHGNNEQFKKIVDDYAWDMCQLQFNYMDENNQAGIDGIRYAYAKGIGIVVMEPLRGGYLVNKLPEKVKELFDESPVKRTPAEWGLRWVWNHPEVTALLSGMNAETQVEENVRIACDARPESLAREDIERFRAVKELMTQSVKIGCTGCSYCMPCPVGVNIPFCFSSYNDKFIYGNDSRQKLLYLIRTSGLDGGKTSYASMCRECGACEKKCPQSLPVRRYLKDVAKEMESFYFKPAAGLIHGYFKIRGGRNGTGGSKPRA